MLLLQALSCADACPTPCIDASQMFTPGSHVLTSAPNHCRRKNLGYLWAIQHGAEELYETDDDNEPVNNMLPNLDDGFYVYNGTGRRVANPYAYFGFPSIWPRGYPLDQIRPEAQMERFSRVAAKPLILQGLADKDPDVDAIFRCFFPSEIGTACMRTHALPSWALRAALLGTLHTAGAKAARSLICM